MFLKGFVMSLFLGGAALLPVTAGAHCDTVQGPVVQEAARALQAGDVTPVLKWVHKEDEARIREAFERTKRARMGASGEARELADTWFFETLVRVHRASEGEPFTGLKPAGYKLPHAYEAADAVLAGKLSGRELERHLQEGVGKVLHERLAVVLEKKRHAGESPEAGRAFVAAYVNYMHFVEGLSGLVEGHPGHGASAGAPHGH